MDLKDFIAETISAIADATTELQEKYSNDGIVVNPPSAQSGADVYQTGSKNYTMRRVQNISFDVAVTAATEKGVGGSVGIKVLSLEIGGKGSATNAAEQVSRVSFAVPITLKPSADEQANIEHGKREAEKQNTAFERAIASREPKNIV